MGADHSHPLTTAPAGLAVFLTVIVSVIDLDHLMNAAILDHLRLPKMNVLAWMIARHAPQIDMFGHQLLCLTMLLTVQLLILRLAQPPWYRMIREALPKLHLRRIVNIVALPRASELMLDLVLIALTKEAMLMIDVPRLWMSMLLVTVIVAAYIGHSPPPLLLTWPAIVLECSFHLHLLVFPSMYLPTMIGTHTQEGVTGIMHTMIDAANGPLQMRNTGNLGLNGKEVTHHQIGTVSTEMFRHHLDGRRAMNATAGRVSPLGRLPLHALMMEAHVHLVLV
jgi:hypothetical protein